MKKDLAYLHKQFMTECEFSVKLSPETLRGYQSSFDLLVKIMPGIELGDLSPEMITEYFKRLETRKRKVGRNTAKQGVKKSTIATYRSKLNKFFEWLRIKGFILENPFRKIAYPAVHYDDKKFLKREQIEKIFSALALAPGKQLTKKRNMALFAVLLNCGLRRSEVINIHNYDIDFERKTLLVKAETSKSKRDRLIPLNSSVLPVLRDYLEERRRNHYTTPFFFVSSNRDDRITRDGLKHLVVNLNIKSGVNFHLHQFRHTFAVNMLNNGCDIAKLKQLMGHSDIRMTIVYLRCLPTKAMRADIERLTFENLI
jgi:integrase/recombinase XerD